MFRDECRYEASGANTESHEEKTVWVGKEDVEQPFASGILEKSGGVALDVASVPVTLASGLGAETLGSHRLKRT